MDRAWTGAFFGWSVLDPQNDQARGLLDNLKGYKSQQERAGASTLTGAQAEAKAVELANEKAQALYNCQPFQKGRPAELVDGYWVWTAGRPYGAADLEATVKFAADGTNPEVTVNLLDSRVKPVGF